MLQFTVIICLSNVMEVYYYRKEKDMVGVFLTTTTLTAKTGLKFGGYDDGDDEVNNHFI